MAGKRSSLICQGFYNEEKIKSSPVALPVGQAPVPDD
jgi:hypothetical protein